MTEDQLLNALQGGGAEREKALKYLFYANNSLLEQVKGYVMKMNGSVEEAEEVFQDAIVAFDEQVRNQQFKGIGPLKAYFFGIAKNKWFSHYKAKKRDITLVEWDTDLLESPLEEVEDKEIKFQILEYGVLQLNKRCQEMLKAFYTDELSMEEIAIKFNLPHFRRAINQMARCRDYLKNQTKNHPLYASNFKKRP
jgi:RNA polymerase sigma factor (sigma-70 family)